MSWLYIMALVITSLGFLSGIMGLKSTRSKKHSLAEFSWEQPPLSGWRYLTTTTIAEVVHSLGAISLTTILVLGAPRDNTFTLIPKSGPELVSAMIYLPAVIFTTHMAGGMIAYHFVQRWIRPMSYGVCSDGMLYGGLLINWKSFSHYEVDTNNGLISLFSSYSPLLRTWVVKPSPEVFQNVLGLIQSNLPPQSANYLMAWQKSPAVLISEISLLSLGALLPAAWGFIQDLSWVWIYALAAFIFVEFVGNKLLLIFDGRGNYPAKQTPTI